MNQIAELHTATAQAELAISKIENNLVATMAKNNEIIKDKLNRNEEEMTKNIENNELNSEKLNEI